MHFVHYELLKIHSDKENWKEYIFCCAFLSLRPDPNSTCALDTLCVRRVCVACTSLKVGARFVRVCAKKTCSGVHLIRFEYAMNAF